jgi:hypothetical protein
MSNINIFQVIFFAILPLGQLWARVFLLNGSLDKKWLFLPFLMMPPFTLIPMIMMKMGKVAMGKGSTPYDSIMLLPILLHLIMTYIVSNMIEKENLYNLLYTLLLFGVTTGILTYRIGINCNFNSKYIVKNIMDSTRIVAIAELIPFMISYIPIIGKAYQSITMIPTIGNIVKELLWSFGFISSYTLNNMINQDNMERYCNVPIIGNIEDILISIMSVVAILFMKFVNNIF